MFGESLRDVDLLAIGRSATQGFLRAARSSRRFNSAANASCAERDPRIHPMTTPTSSAAGMKIRCAADMFEKFTGALIVVSWSAH